MAVVAIVIIISAFNFTYSLFFSLFVPQSPLSTAAGSRELFIQPPNDAHGEKRAPSSLMNTINSLLESQMSQADDTLSHKRQQRKSEMWFKLWCIFQHRFYVVPFNLYDVFINHPLICYEGGMLSGTRREITQYEGKEKRSVDRTAQIMPSVELFTLKHDSAIVRRWVLQAISLKCFERYWRAQLSAFCVCLVFAFLRRMFAGPVVSLFQFPIHFSHNFEVVFLFK